VFTLTGTASSSALLESTVLRRAESALALARSAKRRTPGGHQFVNGQLAVAVSIQLLQRGGCLLDLGRRDLVIPVRIQRHDQQMHGRLVLGLLASRPASPRSSSLATLMASLALSPHDADEKCDDQNR
jgi:hypothetical protein